MEPKKIFLQLRNGIVIAYHSTDIPAKYLAENEKTVDILTATPWLYIGLAEEQITMDPLPAVPPADDNQSEAFTKVILMNSFENLKFQELIRDGDDNSLYGDFFQKVESYFQARYGAEQYASRLKMVKSYMRESRISNQVFDFDNETFPLDQSSINLYRSIEQIKEPISIITSKGSMYELTAPNIDDFLEAFNRYLISNITNYE